MQLIEISEPNANLNNQKEVAVGIDFGTTNSLIAVSFEGIAKIIADENGQEILPSKVQYPNLEISSIKRLFGKNTEEVLCNPSLNKIVNNIIVKKEGSLQLNIDGKLYSPIKIAALIFTKLKVIAENFLQCTINKAVLTLPAYYDEIARAEVMLAAKLAGFEVIRVLAEPTAAAYAYKLNQDFKGKYLVYDLGGGTFDISVLNMQDGIVQVIATGGDNQLGGDDIDILIEDYWQKKYQVTAKTLISIAKEAKESLSKDNEFSKFVESINIEVRLDQETFISIITPVISKTVNIIKQVLSDIDSLNEIKGLILVGGSTRIPLIEKMLKQTFGYEIISTLDPDKVVALGAALQAENLTHGTNTVLIDALPLSLGLELYGGVVEKIILRNSPLPCIVKKEYTTFVDNQTAIEFHIVQGEREFAKDCRSLGTFELLDLPLQKAGSVKIEITFAIDLDGILSISAIEQQTKKEKSILVKPSYGLTNDEVNNILSSSYKNVIIDHEKKLLQESIIKAEKLINNINDFLAHHQLDDYQDKKAEILSMVAILEESLNNKELENIRQNSELLENNTAPFIMEIVNILLNKNLKGQNIDKL